MESFELLLEKEKEQLKWSREQREVVDSMLKEGWAFVEGYDEFVIVGKPNTDVSVMVRRDGKMVPVE